MSDALQAGPLVSIIITNYNYAEFLPAAIDSALGQSWPKIEVILVDDCSTDTSSTVLARYAPRARVIYLAQNGGNGAAFNAGFAASSGAIVLFLDADDALYPNAVETLVKAWLPGTAKVQFYLDAVDRDEHKLGYIVPNIPFPRGSVLPFLYRYGYYPAAPTSGNAYDRAILGQILPVDPGPWRMGLDGLLNALSALSGPVISVHCALGFYRHHSRNASEASGVTLAKIRRDLLNETQREAAIKQAAAEKGRPIRHPLSLRIPSHCKGRLLSLKADPANHPYDGDHALGLALAGIWAAWCFPHLRFRKRLVASAGFLALAVLPVAVLTPFLDEIFIARKRKAWLQRGQRGKALTLGG